MRVVVVSEVAILFQPSRLAIAHLLNACLLQSYSAVLLTSVGEPVLMFRVVRVLSENQRMPVEAD